MATTTNNYKQTSHLPRIVYTEAAPLSGMNYTNVPLASGYAKIVYNLVENPDSTGLRSRPGAVKVNDAIDLPTEVLTTELQYNETDNTFAMKNYFRGKATGTIIAVDSEYGRIYYYLYYSRMSVNGRGMEDFLYTNNLDTGTNPYRLTDTIEQDNTSYDTVDTKNKESVYTPLPVLSNTGDFVATKAFETNDIILLCAEKKYSIKASDLNLDDASRIWYVASPATKSKNTVKSPGIKAYITGITNPVINKISYPIFPQRLSDYGAETSRQTTLPLSSVRPTILDYYPTFSHRFTLNGDDLYMVGGYDSFGHDYYTYYTLSNTQKFQEVFHTELHPKTPICLYKLPSKPINNKYSYTFHTKPTDIDTNSTPIYTVEYTDIKVARISDSQDELSYTVKTSLGFKKSYIGVSAFESIPEGYIDILKLINKNELAKGIFTYNVTTVHNNILCNIIDVLDNDPSPDNIVQVQTLYRSFDNLNYDAYSEAGFFLHDNSYTYTNASIARTSISISLFYYLKNYKYDIPVVDNIKTYPDVTYNFYFTDLSNAPQKIMPKQPTVNEALKYGYNMLLADPYNFTGTKSSDTADTIHFGGLLTYDNNNEIVLNPIMNRTYMFKLITDTTSSTTPACVIIDYKTTAQDVWNHIYDDCNSGLILSDYANDVKFSWQPGVPNALVRVRYYAQTDKELQVNPETNLAFENLAALTAYLAKDTTGKYNKNIFAVKSYSTTVYYRAKFADNVYTTALEYYPEAGDTTEDTLFKQGYRNLRTVPIAMSFERSYETNVSVRNYDFSTAQGMCCWFNRLVVWGVDGGANVLFLSDINDPSYFPYPNNISVFDETVIKALPFQDSLLVFTTTKIWRVDLAEDGMSWYESCIQKNLRIEPKEAHLIEALTTMVFFKSGYLYYLLTPSSKGTGELVIANISKPVIDILQNPDKFFESMESAVYAHYYSNDNKLKLEEHNVYVDSSEIHIVYSYSGTYFDDAKVIDATDNTPSINTLRNYILSYNTNTRKWRVWSFDSDQVPRVLYKDAVGGLVWYTISSRIKDLVKNITDDTPTTYTLQNKLYTFQFLLNDINNADIYDEGVPGGHRAYQYLDTGNREIRKEYYKKFREYQVVFNNRSDNDLQFDVQFCIDDNVIIPLFDGTVTAEADDSLYGSTEQTVFGTVKTLDTSLVFTINKTMWDKFHTVKCKVPVASKGYAPALRILSKNRHSYDLLNITWVYRLKNAR